LWQRQKEDIDLNCGEIADGAATIEQLGERLFQLILATASGDKTKSECFGYGQSEFVATQRRCNTVDEVPKSNQEET
jgi:altronate hydrolase